MTKEKFKVGDLVIIDFSDAATENMPPSQLARKERYRSIRGLEKKAYIGYVEEVNTYENTEIKPTYNIVWQTSDRLTREWDERHIRDYRMEKLCG